MTPDSVIELIRRMLIATFWLSAPLLIVGFIAGVLTSILQIATSIQDTAFSTVPRLAAFLVALLIFLPWLLARLMTFTTSILGNLSTYAR